MRWYKHLTKIQTFAGKAVGRVGIFIHCREVLICTCLSKKCICLYSIYNYVYMVSTATTVIAIPETI